MITIVFSVLFIAIYMHVYICFVVPRFRFSRRGLNDVSVSIVNIATNEDQLQLQFEASVAPLPIAQGIADLPLPTGCNTSSLEFNTQVGWTVNSFSGFFIAERNSRSYLEVYELHNWVLL